MHGDDVALRKIIDRRRVELFNDDRVGLDRDQPLDPALPASWRARPEPDGDIVARAAVVPCVEDEALIMIGDWR